MSEMFRRSTDRMPEKSVRTDLQSVRAGSHHVRIDAKSISLEVVNECRTELGLSVEAMALNAEVPKSSMSDALAGKDNRNFALPWLLAQGAEFVNLHNRKLERRLGLTQESEDDQEAEALGRMFEILMRRSFRARAIRAEVG